MVISAYQVNNVLRVYGDQLRQNKLSNRPKNANRQSPDRINISASARRKAIIDKIASDLVDRLTRYGPQDNLEEEVSRNLGDEYGVQLDITKEGSSDLIFKVIDENGETIKSFSIKDSEFSRQKLKEIGGKNSDEAVMGELEDL